jgi:hypothetical protein
MAETLGSLCDKLTIVKLKQFHSDEPSKTENLRLQERQLSGEIDTFLSLALAGQIAIEKLSFRSNKIYRKEGNELEKLAGASIAGFFAELAEANCELWHEQEKVYAFEEVPASQKDGVVKRLALLNLKRTRCIDAIDQALVGMVQTNEVQHVS